MAGRDSFAHVRLSPKPLTPKPCLNELPLITGSMHKQSLCHPCLLEDVREHPKTEASMPKTMTISMASQTKLGRVSLS